MYFESNIVLPFLPFSYSNVACMEGKDRHTWKLGKLSWLKNHIHVGNYRNGGCNWMGKWILELLSVGEYFKAQPNPVWLESSDPNETFTIQHLCLWWGSQLLSSLNLAVTSVKAIGNWDCDFGKNFLWICGILAVALDNNKPYLFLQCSLYAWCLSPLETVHHMYIQHLRLHDRSLIIDNR